MNRKILPVIILTFGLIISSAVFAQVTSTSGAAKAPTDAQLDTATGITFPIPELGNCTDRESCRSYCNDLNHMSACVDFAQAHGLTNKDEAALAKKYILKVQNKETPGGCTSPDSCNQYCQSISHLNECLSFAKENGVSDDNVREGAQVATYLASGGKTPGGCDTKDACEAYCKDSAHLTECIAFAKNAGMLKRMAAEQGLPEGQFEKLLQLTQDGQAPGGCKSKDQCESYCKDQSHLAECVNFGVKAGFVTQDQADKIIKIGGKGPGGCDSETACKTYCSDPKNTEVCFKFGEENNLIPPDELKATKEGIVQLKLGLDQAPPEIKACLTSVLGADNIAAIQAGTFVPGPAIGEQLKQCGDKFKENFNPEDAFKNAPPAIAQCLKDKVGNVMDKIKSGESQLDSNTADAFRTCVGQAQLTQGAAGGQGAPNLEGMMNGAPPEVQKCISDKLGADFIDKLQKGEAETADIQGKMKDCFQNFRPPMMQGQDGKNQAGEDSGTPRGTLNASPAVIDCLKGKLSAEDFAKLQSGDTSVAKDAIQSCIPSNATPGALPKYPENEAYPTLPTGGSVPSSGGGAPPAAMTPQIDCSQFAAVPSCSYVPVGVAQDACKKCKGN